MSRSPPRGPRRRPSRSRPARSSTSSRDGSAGTWRRGASTTCAWRTASPSGAGGGGANLALPALPGFTLPGDPSASDRYYKTDITEPFVLSPDGHLDVPSGPGLGVTPLPDQLAAVPTWTEWVAA